MGHQNLENDGPDGYVVQVKLGEAVVAAIRDFASSRVPSVAELEADRFKHIRDTKLRHSLAETLHGARWLYNFGLVTLANDVHRAAHVRAQIIDYAAICEAVLMDALTHGVFHNHLSGSKWEQMLSNNVWKQAPTWKKNRHEINLTIRKKRNFYWSIEVATDERIIKPGLKSELHFLREHRNDVHIAELAAVDNAAGIDVSKKAYRIMHTCIEATSDWMRLHP